MNLIVLSTRDLATDFRYQFAQSWHASGHDATYVRVGRSSLIERIGHTERSHLGPAALLRFIRHSTNKNVPNVVLNSMDVTFPVFSLALRIASSRAVWCFDIHDDLLYNRRGAERLKARMKLAWAERLADFSVRAAPLLVELSPKSRHLGNASPLGRIDRPVQNTNDILILSNVDERMDFAFLEATARRLPDRRFHIHGAIAADAAIRASMQRVLADCPNVRHHGPYQNAQLVALLSRYYVSFACYKADDRSTRYIDPLRFYHCLNSGMEIVSTPIPRAVEMAPAVRVAATADAVANALVAIEADLAVGRMAYHPLTTLELKVAELQELVLDQRARSV